jgi:RNA polymerase sigma-70 factor (ECF subfamily)
MAERLVRISAAEPGQADRACQPREAPRPPSFDELVAEQRERVGRLCYRLLGWQADVEDVVQDVFLAALKALPKFRGESTVSTWLTRIAVNACRGHGRKRRLRILAGMRQRSEPRLDRSPEGKLIDRERFERVRAAIRRLPVKYREVVVLRYLEEMAVSEIGEVLGLGRNAVEVRLNRARHRMKKDLAGIAESG